MSVTRFLCQNASLIVFVLWLLIERAFAQSCPIDAPRYKLRDDTVSWSMTMVTGHRCIRGVRFSNVQFESLKLTSPPEFGQVALQGSGFTYSPRADFNGQDSFTIAVFGEVNGNKGSSTIQISVYVAPRGARGATALSITPGRAPDRASTSNTSSIKPDTTPPTISFTAPSDGATISGSFVTLTATASDDVAVANVQFITSGKDIGSALTSPPYSTVWDSTGVADGAYTLYAVAQDSYGNYKTSSVRVTVKNK